MNLSKVVLDTATCKVTLDESADAAVTVVGEGDAQEVTVNPLLFPGEITVTDASFTLTYNPPPHLFLESWQSFKPALVSIGHMVPAEPPTVELLDSSNPFSKALDAWQTGKAGWTKGAYFTRQPERESA